jgi:hypothetical protein
VAFIRRFARSWVCLVFALASAQCLAANPPGVDNGCAANHLMRAQSVA